MCPHIGLSFVILAKLYDAILRFGANSTVRRIVTEYFLTCSDVEIECESPLACGPRYGFVSFILHMCIYIMDLWATTRRILAPVTDFAAW